MTAKELISFHEKRPFQPFIIHVADGRSFPVYHPEFLARSPDNSVLIYWNSSLLWESIDREFVTSLEQVDGNPKPKSKPKK